MVSSYLQRTHKTGTVSVCGEGAGSEPQEHNFTADNMFFSLSVQQRGMQIFVWVVWLLWYYVSAICFFSIPDVELLNVLLTMHVKKP